MGMQDRIIPDRYALSGTGAQGAPLFICPVHMRYVCPRQPVLHAGTRCIVHFSCKMRKCGNLLPRLARAGFV